MPYKSKAQIFFQPLVEQAFLNISDDHFDLETVYADLYSRAYAKHLNEIEEERQKAKSDLMKQISGIDNPSLVDMAFDAGDEFGFRRKQRNSARAGTRYEWLLGDLLRRYLLHDPYIKVRKLTKEERRNFGNIDLMVSNRHTDKIIAFLHLKHSLKERWAEDIKFETSSVKQIIITDDREPTRGKLADIKEHNFIIAFMRPEVYDPWRDGEHVIGVNELPSLLHASIPDAYFMFTPYKMSHIG